MKLEYKVTNNKYFNIKDILKSHFGISDKLLVKLKKHQHIYLNGVPEYVTKKVLINDLIEVDLDFNENFDNIVPVNIDLNIIFEDERRLPMGSRVVHFNYAFFRRNIELSLIYSNGLKLVKVLLLICGFIQLFFSYTFFE